MQSLRKRYDVNNNYDYDEVGFEALSKLSNILFYWSLPQCLASTGSNLNRGRLS
jgi:hypothetical protein